jgi:hypothetical protein
LVQPERDAQGLLLPFRQGCQVVEPRHAQLVERRERHFQLGLDSGDPDDPAADRLASAVVH